MPVVTCAAGYPAGGFAQPHCNADSRRSDGVQFNYAADPVSTWPTVDGAATDCLGQALPDGGLSSARFFVKLSSSTGEPELYCEGAGRGATQPVVEGIETLRLRYWLKGNTTGETTLVDQLDAQSISRLRLISVCVLVRGRPGPKNSAYSDCDGQKRQSTDRRKRQAYRLVLAFRNLIEPQGNG
jgi:type IV pilus assembly protein PilW